MNNIEDKIRDNIANNLYLVNSDYTLIDTEYYIPEAKTTKSFIDILAQDSKHNYIIIEVKRSNQSARQAIHEIYKYTEALKEKLKITPGEIIATIISTEWSELYIPFSAFANETAISIEGLKIHVDDKLNILSTERIKPYSTSKGRVFSPVHHLSLYIDQENLKKGIESHVDIYKLKGIESYVLITLESKEFDQNKYKEDLAVMMSNMLGTDRSEFAEYIEKMEVYPYMIYSAHQRLSAEEYYSILQKDQEVYDEVKNYIESSNINEEDEVLMTLENSVFGDLKPYFFSNTSEIGYPAKFAHKIIGEEGWKINKIIRSNSLLQNTLLTDEKIISEIEGNTGIDGVILKDKCLISHKAKFLEIKENMLSALKYNSIWQNNLKLILENLTQLKNSELEINIYSPSHILLTLIFMVVNENHINYMPNYILKVTNSDTEEIYLGAFHWNGKKPKFEKIIRKYYNNDPANIIMTLSWGGHENRDESILKKLGLSYVTYRIQNKTELSILKDFKFKRVNQIKNGLIDFINKNPKFMDYLVATYYAHYHEAKIT